MTRQLMPVLVRGTLYPSAQHCADALGVKRETVYSALQRDAADTIGLGPQTPGRGVPFRYRDLHWPSACAASLALGMHRHYIAKALRTGGFNAQHNLTTRLEAYYKETLK